MIFTQPIQVIWKLIYKIHRIKIKIRMNHKRIKIIYLIFHNLKIMNSFFCKIQNNKIKILIIILKILNNNNNNNIYNLILVNNINNLTLIRNKVNQR